MFKIDQNKYVHIPYLCLRTNNYINRENEYKYSILFRYAPRKKNE